VLRARFSDAQCGFKAARTEALRAGLLDAVRDDGWFFDTELLVLAQRGGLRIHEVPVDWIDDPDTRVKIVRTALEDLRALLPLVAPLVSGHSDLAIGTRLAHGARVVRGPKRELISRGYNHLLHATLRVRFSDAQCGFKAVRRDALQGLLADVRDDRWFFDTELLVLAQRRGLRIHEVPVDWIDDPDSRVDIVRTALADLRGIARLLATSSIARFAAVGVLSTLAYVALYLLLRAPLGPDAANALVLALTAVANTAANRRLTFGVRGPAGLVRHHVQGAVVFVLTLALTSGALRVLYGVDPDPAPALEVLVLVLASACATVSRYVALRSWVFARGRHDAGAADRPAVERAAH